MAPEHDELEANSDEDPTGFRFIDLTRKDPDSQKKNRTKVRSHVMKVIRRQQRAGDKSLKWVMHSLIAPTDSRTHTDSEYVTASIDGSMLACANSSLLRIEADGLPRLTDTWKWTPWAYRMLRFTTDIALKSLLPAISKTEVSAGALEVWQIIRSSPMAVHAVIAGSAVHLDWQNQSMELSRSPEALAHRGQALRLVNEEISRLHKESEPSDALFLAIQALIPLPPGHSTQTLATDRDHPASRPFRPAQAQLGWADSRLRVQYSQAHHRGVCALVNKRGGLLAFRNQAVARLISSNDLVLATQELRAPKHPFIQDREVASLISNPGINVLEANPLGSSLSELLHTIGASSPLSSVLLSLHRVMATTEARVHGALRNVNITALYGEKQALLHAVLSLPPLRPLSRESLYEPLRLIALIYAVGILYQMSPSTGALVHLVFSLKASVEAIDVDQLNGIQTKALVWILFIGGIASKGIRKREWYIERLSKLIKVLGLTRWVEVRQLLRSFVWVPYSMDDEAMGMWEGVRFYEDL